MHTTEVIFVPFLEADLQKWKNDRSKLLNFIFGGRPSKMEENDGEGDRRAL